MWLRLTKNKTFEIDFMVGEVVDIFDIGMRWTRKSDHAGFFFDIYILGIWFSVSISDNRHWNDKANDWENCDDHE